MLSSGHIHVLVSWKFLDRIGGVVPMKFVFTIRVVKLLLYAYVCVCVWGGGCMSVLGVLCMYMEFAFG